MLMKSSTKIQTASRQRPVDREDIAGIFTALAVVAESLGEPGRAETYRRSAELLPTIDDFEDLVAWNTYGARYFK